MKASLSGPITWVVKLAARGLDSLVDILPPSWAAKVRSARKAIVGAASASAGILAAALLFPLPGALTPWIAAATALVTGIATYWVPNAEVQR